MGCGVSVGLNATIGGIPGYNVVLRGLTLSGMLVIQKIKLCVVSLLLPLPLKQG